MPSLISSFLSDTLSRETFPEETERELQLAVQLAVLLVVIFSPGLLTSKKRDAQTGLTQLEAAAIGRVAAVQRTPEHITSPLAPCGLQGGAH